MTIREELIEYANDCISGKIISCQKHIWACKRLLNDFQKKDWEYYWDEDEALKIVKWFSYLRHSKGVLAGQPIILITWQKFFLCQIYGWRNKKTGKKRFKKSFVEVARKQAKSQMQAGVLLYEISVQATANNEIYETYCAGTKREQSQLIFKECKNMLKGSELASKFGITKAEITHLKTESFLKPLSKEDGKKGDGTNPAVLVLDEYHQHQTTEFYDLALGGNSKESMLMIITTAGIDLNVPCYTQEYEYCSNLLNPAVNLENDEYFTDICEIDKGDDIDNIENWKKANPLRMSYQEGIDKLISDYKIAKEVPEKMIAFRTKCLDEWVQALDCGYMDMAKWKACEVKEIPFDIKGKPVYVGFDMSSKIDLTSVAFIIPVMYKDVASYAVFSHSFIPNREKLIERLRVDKMPYDSWEERGFITVTDTPIVDQEQVIDYVIKTCAENEWEIKSLCFDPANASKIMMDLSDRGYEVVEVYQSYKSLNESTAGFREQVYSGNVYHVKNPVLDFAMGNAVIRVSNGLIKIDKDAARKRIDPVDAVLGGFKLAMYHEYEFDINSIINEETLKRMYGGGEYEDN